MQDGRPTHARPSADDLGEAIRRLRKERRPSEKRTLSIEALAGDVGVTSAYLNEIELGKRNPTWEVLNNIAAALDVRLSDIVLRAEALADQRASGTDSPRLDH